MVFLNMVLLILLLVLTAAECSLFSNTSTALKSSLLTGYDKGVRPDEITSVELTMVLTSLNKLDTASQSMAITVLWFTMWQDDRLSWDPGLYNNITSLTLAKKEAWVPPIVLTNEVDDVGLIGSEDVPLRAFSSGQILWIPPTALETSCEIDVSNYPFDIQTCAVNITGWTMDVEEMDLQPSSEAIDISLYSEHGEWDLVKRNVIQYDFNGGFDKRYRSLQYILTFRRLWTYYGLSLICPLALSSLLMAGVFAVPVESGEKIGYSLTVLLSFTVLLTLISDSLPPISTKISALQIYLSTLTILGALVTFLSLLVVWLYHRDDRKPLPRAVLVIYRVMACCVCQPVSSKPQTNSVKPVTTLVEMDTNSVIFNSKSANTRALNSSRKDIFSEESDEERVTWQDFARCLDAVCLRFFTVLFIVLIVGFLGYMYSIYYSS